MVNIFPDDADAAVPGTCFRALKTTALEEHPADNDGGIIHTVQVYLISLCLFGQALLHCQIFIRSEWLGGRNTLGIGIIVMVLHQTKVEGLCLRGLHHRPDA